MTTTRISIPVGTKNRQNVKEDMTGKKNKAKTVITTCN